MAPLMADQEEAIFACGCFWGAEKGFWRLPGVVSTAVGYAGGQIEQPTYNQVCSGRTGHTEVVRVVWSRPALDFSDLLKLFWECHDPTQGNRQGNDTGSQYRSAIYTFNPEHLQLALASRDAYQAALSAKGYGAITTEILADQTFYFAEDYHQQYLAKPGSRPYCSAMPTQPLRVTSRDRTTNSGSRSEKGTTGRSVTACFDPTTARSPWVDSAKMRTVPTHVMPEPWSDRPVILAIALTLILVLGLILGSVSFHREQQAPMLWRETPQPTAKPLAI